MSCGQTVVSVGSLNDFVFPLSQYFLFGRGESVFSVLITAREKMSNMLIGGNAGNHRDPRVPNYLAPESRAVELFTVQHCQFNEPHFQELSHINVVTCFEDQSKPLCLSLNTIVESPTDISSDCQRQGKFLFQYESHSWKNKRQRNSINHQNYLKQGSDLVAYIAFIRI